MSSPAQPGVPHTPHYQARDAREKKRQMGRRNDGDSRQVPSDANPKPPPPVGRKSPPWMTQGGRRGCRSRGGEPVAMASRAPPVASGRDVLGLRRRRTCPAHTLRPPLRGRPGGCDGVLPNYGGWTVCRRTSSAQLEMLTHRCPLPRVKYCPHRTGHANCRRGRRGERTPPADAGCDLTDAPAAARHLLPRPLHYGCCSP